MLVPHSFTAVTDKLQQQQKATNVLLFDRCWQFNLLNNFNQVCFHSPGACRKRTSQNFCCVFPFIYRGRRYNRCTRIKSRRPWCALTPNYDVDKLFGYCGRRGI